MKSHSLKYLPVFLFALVIVFTFGSFNSVAAQDQPQSNLLVIREASISQGKMAEAMKFALEIRDFLNEKMPDFNARVYVRMFGEVNKIYWITESKDVATLETNMKKLMADPEHRTIYSKAVGLFIEGESYVRLLGLIP